MYPSSIALRAKIGNEGTEAERRLSTLLFDDHMHVLSSFEMNSVASLSYEDETCEQIFDLLEEVMRHPIDHPVLAVEKSLAITKHLLIYGSEKCVNSCWGLRSYVERLCEFNTVILAQQQKGLGSLWHSIKGGSVDKGFAVREASEKLYKLLGDETRIQSLRNDLQDPNSLVPVGSNEDAAFVSDEIRHYMLKKRMDEQNLRRTRSNLAKADKGFGSGFSAANGQTVVGAAHGLDEMLARAQREEKKFSETGPVHFRKKTDSANKASSPKVSAVTVDLLDFQAPVPPSTQPQVDLLDFGSTPTPAAPTPATTLDIFAAPTTDLLAMQSGNDDLLSPQIPIQATGDLLSALSVSTTTNEDGVKSDVGIFETNSVAVLNEDGVKSDVGILETNSAAVPTPMVGGLSEVSTGSSIMSSNADRFAALDALSPPSSAVKVSSTLSGKEAENRILGFSESGATETFQASARKPSIPSTGEGGIQMPDSLAGDASIQTATVPQFANVPHVSVPPAQPDMHPPPIPSYAIHDDATLGIAEKYGDANNDDEGCGFVMGGMTGSGLEPVGPAPAAPPPPPP